ncbi:hypothetical protein WKK05_37285 (plasmid) [Nostoc sp. UHCC 0302]
MVKIAREEELLRNQGNFKPPKVGSPDNRQGGATRQLEVPEIKLG